jgi:hypothetical protein
MEVHHHAHTPRKKWTHYLWEFLMLFLAVFCGFLAENEREHLIEHQREKQFMRSMVEDLQKDTTELKKAISKAKLISTYSDSVVIFLRSYKPGNRLPISFDVATGYAGMQQSIINTDRTSSQLKNSGSMRMIRDREVNEKILEYWKQIEETNISRERYMLYRNGTRELSFELFVIPAVHAVGTGMSPDSLRTQMKEIDIIDNDPRKWAHFLNMAYMTGFISRGAHLRNLELQYKIAEELILLIRKKYRMK